MKHKNDQGFSLIEVLVAIVILAAFVVPTCSALVLSARMNAKTQALMQAQLDVSSAVEILMARGITETEINGETSILGLAAGVEWDDPVTKVSIQNTEPEYAVLLEKYPDLRKSKDNECFSLNVFWLVQKDISGGFYNVTAISKDGLVEVTTSVKKVS